MKKTHRHFDQKFMDAATYPVLAGTISVNARANELDIHESVLRRWVNKAKGVPSPSHRKGGRKDHIHVKSTRDRANRVTEEERAAALAEWEAGGRVQDIAKRMGVSHGALSYWKKVRDKTGARPGKAIVAVPVNGNGEHRIPQIATQHAMRDATLFLRKAKSELMRGIKQGTIDDLDQAHLLSLLALNSLQGG